MGILWLLSCEFGACFVFFGARVGSSSPFFWKLQWSMPSVVGTLAEKRVLSSFMGVQEKQMKQRNICQVLSSELLLSDIYSCTCLMLILFYSDWPFCRRKKKRKLRSPLKSDIFVQQPELSLIFYRRDSLQLHQGWVFNPNAFFPKSPPGESHQKESGWYTFRR